MTYYTYLIKSKLNNITYIGITNNLEKRLYKHNNKLGAKATRRHSDWEYIKIVQLTNKNIAASLEYYWKHYLTQNNTFARTKPGIKNKIDRLNEIIKNYEHVIIL